jgi:hypothetical protein
MSSIQLLQQNPKNEADQLFGKALRQALKKVLLGVEVTGLYGDSVLKQAKEEMFVLPDVEMDNVPSGLSRAEKKQYLASSFRQHGDKFLDFGSRSLVRGVPGAGKSTWSKWLQVYAIRDQKLLALHVKVRAFAGSKLPPVLDLIKDLVGSNMSQEVGASVVADWVKSGKICVILDGFDELSPDLRGEFLDDIIDLSGYLSKCSCLLTSRPLNTDHLERIQGEWKEWSILPFNKSKITEYISKWYKNAPLKDGASREVNENSLYESLTRDPHVAPLTGNPLMLATLLMVHHNDGELPKGRSKLYSRYIDGMLGIWDDRQEIKADTSGLDREQKKRILTILAISLHLRNIDEMAENEVLSVVSKAMDEYGYNGSARDVLDSLRERSGLIVGPGSYSFSHKSIGEYLVAQGICDGDKCVDGQRLDRFRLNSERSNDRWLNVMYFWAGSAPVGDVKTFIDGMNQIECMGLISGLLWDQMDRFQKDWISPRIIKCVQVWDDLADSEMEVENSIFFAWEFALEEEEEFFDHDEFFEPASVRVPPIKHVALHRFDRGRAFQELLHKIDFKVEDLASIRNLGIYNAAANAIMSSAPEKVFDWYSEVKIFDRWPLWLQKSQSAFYIWLRLMRDPREEWIHAWGDLWDLEEGMLGVWIAPAIIIGAENKLRVRSWDVESLLKGLEVVIGLEWSDESLRLSPYLYYASAIDSPRDVIASLFELLSGCVEDYSVSSERVFPIEERVKILEDRRNKLGVFPA